MNIKTGSYSAACKLWITIFFTVSIAACSSSDEEDGNGFLKFYNASANAPAIYITIDEDLDEDEDGEVEQTYSNISYGRALSNQEVPTGDYFYELAWQDEDSNARSDLEIVFEDSLSVETDEITLVVMTDDVLNPDVTIFNVPIVDDEDDTDDDLFNLRFLNLTPLDTAIDIYMSKSDETFNESEFMGSFSYLELSDNIKREEDQYTFYITLAGSDEVLFESAEVSYPFSSQYIIAVRPSEGAGESPFVIDNIGNTTIAEYQASDAEARFQIYNGMQLNDLLPEYDGELNVNADIETSEPQTIISNLAMGDISQSFTVENGDYSLSLSNASSSVNLLQSQLLSLPENTDRTVFYYLIEEYADEDGDGDFDEDGDGVIDEIEVKITASVVNNSTRERIYDHEVKMLNLAYSNDFSRVTFYFVKSDEIIETADNRRATTIGNPESLVLLNNTYEVYAIAEIDGNEIILDKFDLSLNEESDELYLILEENPSSGTGYAMKVFPQISSTPSN